jgi:hypothetical protein
VHTSSVPDCVPAFLVLMPAQVACVKNTVLYQMKMMSLMQRVLARANRDVEVKTIVMENCDNRCLQHGHSARNTGNPVQEIASCVHVPRSKTIHHFLMNKIIITL